MGFIITILDWIIRLLELLVIIQAVLSFFMSPFNPIRQTIDRVVEPMLRPIRRVLPPMGMFDFSPLVLLILLYILDALILSLR